MDLQERFFLEPEANLFVWRPFLTACGVDPQIIDKGVLALVIDSELCEKAKMCLPKDYSMLIVLDDTEKQKPFGKQINCAELREKLGPLHRSPPLGEKVRLTYELNRTDPNEFECLKRYVRHILWAKDWANLGRWIRGRPEDDTIFVCLEGFADETPFRRLRVWLNGIHIGIYNHVLSWARAERIRHLINGLLDGTPGRNAGPKIETLTFWYGSCHSNANGGRRQTMVNIFANEITSSGMKNRVLGFLRQAEICPDQPTTKFAMEMILKDLQGLDSKEIKSESRLWAERFRKGDADYRRRLRLLSERWRLKSYLTRSETSVH